MALEIRLIEFIAETSRFRSQTARQTVSRTDVLLSSRAVLRSPSPGSRRHTARPFVFPRPESHEPCTKCVEGSASTSSKVASPRPAGGGHSPPAVRPPPTATSQTSTLPPGTISGRLPRLRGFCQHEQDLVKPPKILDISLNNFRA